MIGAIDFGGTKTIIGIVDDNGSILVKERILTVDDYKTHVENCTSVFSLFLKRFNLSINDFKGIGITVPGLADADKGILIESFTPKLRNVDIAGDFSLSLKIDNVKIENDVKACALAEMKWGHTQYKNYIWLTISTGVGGAIVSNGQLIKGQGMAGEIGHVKVEYNNPKPCRCGQFGCLQAYCSGNALGDNALGANAEKLAMLARGGNSAAIKTFETMSEYLARGLSNAINIFNPEAVILGGGVSRALDIIEKPLRKSLSKYVMDKFKNIDIIESKMGYDAGLFGAIALVN